MNINECIEKCQECEKFINSQGKRCPWRDMSNDYCWVDEEELEWRHELIHSAEKDKLQRENQNEKSNKNTSR